MSALKIDSVQFTPVRIIDTKATPVDEKKELAGTEKSAILKEIKASEQAKVDMREKPQPRAVVYTDEDGDLVVDKRLNGTVLDKIPDKPKVGMNPATISTDRTTMTYTKDATIKGTTQTPLGKDPSAED